MMDGTERPNGDGFVRVSLAPWVLPILDAYPEAEYGVALSQRISLAVLASELLTDAQWEQARKKLAAMRAETRRRRKLASLSMTSRSLGAEEGS